MSQLDFWTYYLVRRSAPIRSALTVLLFPGITAVAAHRAVSRLGTAARTARGLSRPVQALELWELALRYPLAFGSNPTLYYHHEIFDPARRGEAPFLLSSLHQNVLTRVVNGAVAGFLDKRDFERRCVQEQLPHIDCIAEVEPDGGVTWYGDAVLPPVDLFSKPAKGGNGSGAARWIRQPDGRYRSESGAVLDGGGLLSALRSAARGGALIVQPCVRNHPMVEGLVGSTLATIRFVSLLLPDGAWEPVLAIQRSAAADSAVDNSARGGVACPVDLATGTLGPAMTMGEAGVCFSSHHPRTAAEVQGARLPFWTETLQLVERAHRTFPGCPALGWDIAITAEGPLLVEANTIWIAKSLQAAHRLALGRTRYANRLLDLLERRACSAEMNTQHW
jgi:hypothetical protein